MTHPLIDQLTLEEKASLVSGATFWTTRAVERVGLEAATLTDGPHGVRMQTAGADQLGINDSHPATAFPTAAALGSTWDAELLEEIGRALGAESRRLTSKSCSDRASTSSDPLCAGAISSTSPKTPWSLGRSPRPGSKAFSPRGSGRR